MRRSLFARSPLRDASQEPPLNTRDLLADVIDGRKRAIAGVTGDLAARFPRAPAASEARDSALKRG